MHHPSIWKSLSEAVAVGSLVLLQLPEGSLAQTLASPSAGEVPVASVATICEIFGLPLFKMTVDELNAAYPN
jgi:hypothetical protein